MQPENGNITPVTPSSPANWPQVDLAAGGADDETIECALAQVEHRLEAWSEALEARAAQLAEAQERLGQQERSLEQARHSSTESRQQLETDEQQTNERNEARLRELDERQAELDAREARLARQQAELENSIREFEERQAAPEAPAAEPADTEPASESGIEPEAHAAQKDRVLLPRGDGAQTAAQDASEDKPVVAVPAAVLPDQPEPAQPPGSVGPPVTEPRPQPAADEPWLSDDSSETGPPVADEPPTASGPPPAGQSPPAGEPPAADEIPSVDLDPETARKLRVLRRLAGPGKTDAELLAQLAAREPNEDAQEKSSKRWWKRGR